MKDFDTYVTLILSLMYAAYDESIVIMLPMEAKNDINYLTLTFQSAEIFY